MMKFKGLVVGTAVAIATLSAMASRTEAQTANFDEPTVLEALDEITTSESGDYSSDRSNFRQLSHFFGLGLPGRSAYPELELDRNSDAILEAYNELLLLQTRNTPTIRTPDLPSPYTTSLQQMPGQAGGRVVGTEFNFQPLPRR